MRERDAEENELKVSTTILATYGKREKREKKKK